MNEIVLEMCGEHEVYIKDDEGKKKLAGVWLVTSQSRSGDIIELTIEEKEHYRAKNAIYKDFKTFNRWLRDNHPKLYEDYMRQFE